MWLRNYGKDNETICNVLTFFVTGLQTNVPSLKSASKIAILKSTDHSAIGDLPIPKTLQQYLR